MAIFRFFSHVLTFPRSPPTIEPRPRQKKRWERFGQAIAYYGIYSINETEKTLIVRVNGNTFANLIGGPEQKRHSGRTEIHESTYTGRRHPPNSLAKGKGSVTPGRYGTGVRLIGLAGAGLRVPENVRKKRDAAASQHLTACHHRQVR